MFGSWRRMVRRVEGIVISFSIWMLINNRPREGSRHSSCLVVSGKEREG
jgi:hypothetical protein